MFAPRAAPLLPVGNSLRSRSPAFPDLRVGFDRCPFHGARRSSSAAGDGSPSRLKLPEPIGVPTRSGPLDPFEHSHRSKRSSGATTAPIGPEVFPMERRSRYETRVYADLCPFCSVDTLPSTDTLQKDKKDLKTNGFGGFSPGSMGRRESGWGRGQGSCCPASRTFELCERGGTPRERRRDAARHAGALRSDRRRRAASVSAWKCGGEMGRGPASGMRARSEAAGLQRRSTPRIHSISDAEVLDFEGISSFARSSDGSVPPSAERPGQPARGDVAGRAALKWLGLPRRCSTGWVSRVGLQPAQPLHRFSAVDRVERSSPQEAAVSGDQEKMR